LSFGFPRLKHQYPLILLVLAFGGAVVLSLRHDRAPQAELIERAATTVTTDQITLSAMHAEPAPGATARSIPAASPRDLTQVKILDEIVASRSDNDPRLDTELRGLTDAGKILLRGRYASYSPEKRNERGTVVFLLGRELSSPEDVGFLHQVLTEPACRSLSNCDRDDTSSVGPGEAHLEGPAETTLAYPQIVALKSLQAYLTRPDRDSALDAQARSEIELARRSPIRKVAALAEEIAGQLKPGKSF
jgi:hypothetical protein